MIRKGMFKDYYFNGTIMDSGTAHHALSTLVATVSSMQGSADIYLSAFEEGQAPLWLTAMSDRKCFSYDSYMNDWLRLRNTRR